MTRVSNLCSAIEEKRSTAITRAACHRASGGFLGASMFVCWFREAPSAEWVALTTAQTQAEAYRLLVKMTRGKGGAEAQRFVCRQGRTPSEWLDPPNEVPQEAAGHQREGAA